MRLASLGDILYLLYPILPLRWMFRLARLRGRLSYGLKKTARRVVRNNLAGALTNGRPADDLDVLTRKFFEDRQLRALLIMLAPRMSTQELASLFRIEGLEHLDRAVERGRGVLLLGSHLHSVCMFLAIVLLRRRGYDIRVAMPTRRDPWSATRLRRYIDSLSRTPSLREQLGAFYAQFNVRPIVSHLRSKRIVAQTGDGWHSAGFVDVDFLGRSLPFTTGVMSIARLTGCSIVPLFTVGDPPYGMSFIFEEPFTVEKTENTHRDLQASVARYARMLERHLLDNISSWEHWGIEDTLNTLAEWPRRPLGRRYEIEANG